MKVVNVPVAEISVHQRSRKDMGDIESLATSIDDLGLLQPVVVDSEKRLISGERRLRACKSLKRDTIPAHVITTVDEAVDRLKAERDENTCRKPFAPSEAVALGQQLEKLEAKAAKARQGTRTDLQEKQLSGKLPRSTEKARDKVGASVGMSGRNYEKAKAVIESGNETAIALMDDTGKIDRAYREVTKAERDEGLRDKSLALPEGQYDLILADPPWKYEYSQAANRSIENHYPTMELDEILAIQLPAASDCVLFLWATSPKLAEAIAVLGAWRFSYRTCMVWVKGSIGMGVYARQRHELLLIAVRGKPLPPEESQRPDSVIEAPRGKHSEKPAAVYDIIESMYPHSRKLEMFARTSRNGWHTWGNEAPTQISVVI